MTTKEIANRLVVLCKSGDFDKPQKELFAQDAVSIEPHATPAFEKETKGLKAIEEKGKKWHDMVKELHSIDVSDPVVAGNSFACSMHMDVTMQNGERMDMNELCVYKVKDGKIIEEEFFM
ncbi:SnoaL-like domain-containing protein [Ferruginibacter albus]|uniref:SnoaL-like domain-containing protein n=1 Tax=Ferruginibacter albus TaxID=2875540 RepID=UPI001CC485B5|nr:SnoaL-like domain-containing protein [Ferruginibacter albus]UAY53463.1 nuclear transport factor 2 family protein [Ferruginibacter albus]